MSKKTTIKGQLILLKFFETLVRKKNKNIETYFSFLNKGLSYQPPILCEFGLSKLRNIQETPFGLHPNQHRI